MKVQKVKFDVKEFKKKYIILNQRTKNLNDYL